jgi:hypothetical protein
MHKSLLIIALLMLTGCNEDLKNNFIQRDNEIRVTISQGVWGTVRFWEGDFMPSTDHTSGKITPVVRDIYIYEAATMNDLVFSSSSGVFVNEVKTKFVKKVTSDKAGFFQTALEPGNYSFFVKENDLYFASETTKNGYVMFANVKKNSVSKRLIDINYKAVY